MTSAMPISSHRVSVRDRAAVREAHCREVPWFAELEARKIELEHRRVGLDGAAEPRPPIADVVIEQFRISVLMKQRVVHRALQREHVGHGGEPLAFARTELAIAVEKRREECRGGCIAILALVVARDVEQQHGDVLDEPRVLAVVEVERRDLAVGEAEVVRMQIGVDQPVMLGILRQRLEPLDDLMRPLAHEVLVGRCEAVDVDDVVLVPLLASEPRIRWLVGPRAFVQPREQPAEVAKQRRLPVALFQRRRVVEHDPVCALERRRDEVVAGLAIVDALDELAGFGEHR